MRRTGLIGLLICGLIGGSVAVAAIVVGALFDIPGYSPRTGYWGLHALDSMLYSMSDDTAAFVTLSIFAFAQGAVVLGIPLRLLVRRRSKRSRNDRVPPGAPRVPSKGCP